HAVDMQWLEISLASKLAPAGFVSGQRARGCPEIFVGVSLLTKRPVQPLKLQRLETSPREQLFSGDPDVARSPGDAVPTILPYHRHGPALVDFSALKLRGLS
ncbi:hypothetical protein, partial [Pseudomonas sp. efr-133-TYG-103a]|uniref:hypothetical protein n=1 Tax=Pseudomonas sp. efr-133-TYG-103a TaxID=3040308 RepID=UPI002553FCE8